MDDGPVLPEAQSISRPIVPEPEDGSESRNHRAQGPPAGPSRLGLLGLFTAVAALIVLFVVARDQASEPASLAESVSPSEPVEAPRVPDGAPIAPGIQVSTPLSDLTEPTGLWLFYGGEDRLQRLDIDTGTMTKTGLAAFPVATTGNELVLINSAARAVGWIGLHDLFEQPEGWIRNRVAQPSSELFWFYDAERETWKALDPATNRVMAERSAPRQVFPNDAGDPHLLVSGADVIGTTNGIYEFTGIGYERIVEGTLWAYTSDLMLVESCGDLLGNCTTAWIDRETLEVAPVATPDYRIASAQLVGGDRWLDVVGTNGQRQLFPTRGGLVRDIGSSTNSLTVGPDGRWLAVDRADGLVELTDLLLQVTYPPLTDFSMASAGALLFDEKPRAA